jgi:hypothetical protein
MLHSCPFGARLFQCNFLFSAGLSPSASASTSIVSCEHQSGREVSISVWHSQTSVSYRELVCTETLPTLPRRGIFTGLVTSSVSCRVSGLHISRDADLHCRFQISMAKDICGLRLTRSLLRISARRIAKHRSEVRLQSASRLHRIGCHS